MQTKGTVTNKDIAMDVAEQLVEAETKTHILTDARSVNKLTENKPKTKKKPKWNYSLDEDIKEGDYAMCFNKKCALPVGAVGFVLHVNGDKLTLMFEPNQYPCLRDLRDEERQYCKSHWKIIASHYRYFIGDKKDFCLYDYATVWQNTKGSDKVDKESKKFTKDKEQAKREKAARSTFSIHKGDYFVVTAKHLELPAGTIGRCLSTEVLYGTARFDKADCGGLHNVVAGKDTAACKALGFDPHDNNYYTFPMSYIRPVNIADVIPNSLKSATVSAGDTVQLPNGAIGRAVYVTPQKDGMQVLVASELNTCEEQTDLTSVECKESKILARKAYAFGLNPSEKIYTAFWDKELIVV